MQEEVEEQSTSSQSIRERTSIRGGDRGPASSGAFLTSGGAGCILCLHAAFNIYVTEAHLQKSTERPVPIVISGQ